MSQQHEERAPTVARTPAPERAPARPPLAPPQRAARYAVDGLPDALNASEPRLAALDGALVQLREAVGAARADDADGVREAAERGVRGPGAALPHADRIQAAFGAHDVSGVTAHLDGGAREAAGAIGARAYATGNHVAFAGAPDLHTAAHEAAHVVQQRSGVQLKGGVGQRGDAYERHADAVADAVVAGRSAEGLLGPVSVAGPGRGASAEVQRNEIPPEARAAAAVRGPEHRTGERGAGGATDSVEPDWWRRPVGDFASGQEAFDQVAAEILSTYEDLQRRKDSFVEWATEVANTHLDPGGMEGLPARFARADVEAGYRRAMQFAEDAQGCIYWLINGYEQRHDPLEAQLAHWNAVAERAVLAAESIARGDASVRAMAESAQRAAAHGQDVFEGVTALCGVLVSVGAGTAWAVVYNVLANGARQVSAVEQGEDARPQDFARVVLAGARPLVMSRLRGWSAQNGMTVALAVGGYLVGHAAASGSEARRASLTARGQNSVSVDPGEVLGYGLGYYSARVVAEATSIESIAQLQGSDSLTISLICLADLEFGGELDGLSGRDIFAAPEHLLNMRPFVVFGLMNHLEAILQEPLPEGTSPWTAALRARLYQVSDAERRLLGESNIYTELTRAVYEAHRSDGGYGPARLMHAITQFDPEYIRSSGLE